MREIKFRGNDGCDWIYSEIVMYDIDYLNGEEKEIGFMCTGEVEDWDNGWRRVCYVGQYTNINDINNVEIYEGDIVRSDATCIGGVDFVGIAKFYDGCFVIDNGKDAIPLFSELDTRTVLGNIYENPELLEVQ